MALWRIVREAARSALLVVYPFSVPLLQVLHGAPAIGCCLEQWLRVISHSFRPLRCLKAVQAPLK